MLILVAIEEEPNESVTLKDPNMQDNPSMKVLGVINENDDLEKQKSSKMKPYNSENIEKDKGTTNSTKMQDQITDKQIAELSKNPSDIYKHAYKMLIQENFLEAEKRNNSNFFSRPALGIRVAKSCSRPRSTTRRPRSTRSSMPTAVPWGKLPSIFLTR